MRYLASQRQGTHNTKTRAKLPVVAKSLGAKRALVVPVPVPSRGPVWVGGGRAHGPKPRDYAYRLPTKQRRLALRSSLRYRIEGGQFFAVEGLEEPVGQAVTKVVGGFLKGSGLAGSRVYCSSMTTLNPTSTFPPATSARLMLLSAVTCRWSLCCNVATLS